MVLKSLTFFIEIYFEGETCKYQKQYYINSNENKYLVKISMPFLLATSTKNLKVHCLIYTDIYLNFN